MFDNKSDYALNKKDQDSIVYCGSDGYVAHITRADFSSEEEFLFWNSCSGSPGRMPITRRLTMPIPTFIGILLDWTPSGTTPVTSLPQGKCCFTRRSAKNRCRKQ